MPTPRIKGISQVKMDNILRASLAEFSKNSYPAASFNRIIKNSKLAKGTMYYYFSSKEDLFLTLVRGVEQGILSYTRGLLEQKVCSDFWRGIEDYLDKFLAFGAAEPQVFQFIFKNLLKNTAHDIKNHPAINAWQKIDHWLEEILVLGQKQGFVRTDLPVSWLSKIIGSTLAEAPIWHEGAKLDRIYFKKHLLNMFVRQIGVVDKVPSNATSPLSMEDFAAAI